MPLNHLCPMNSCIRIKWMTPLVDLQRLIWVCTICLCPIYESLGIYGLKKAALLFCFFGGFRCGMWLCFVILVKILCKIDV